MKTCKECEHFNLFFCKFNKKCRSRFSVDVKIQSMSDEELAESFVCEVDKVIFYSHFTGGFYASKNEAITATIEELKKEWKG